MADTTNPENVLALIKQLSIEPFQSLLAKLLRCEPTEHAIQAHANKYPDKHLQALTMAARLAGYHKDAPAVQNNMFVVIQGMSDSELRQLNQKLDVERKQLMEQTVDGQLDSLTPSHDAQDGKVSTSPIASSGMPIAIEPPHVVDEA